MRAKAGSSQASRGYLMARAKGGNNSWRESKQDGKGPGDKWSSVPCQGLHAAEWWGGSIGKTSRMKIRCF